MKPWRLILFLFILCLNYSAQAKNKTLSYPIRGSQNLVLEINRAIHQIDPTARVGIAIKSMKYGDVLYTKNEQQLFTPASILKILTAEAALLYLGPNYHFPTALKTDALHINNGVLNGNIYLVHSGDPSLTFYDLTDLMVTLKAQQIQGVSGNIYIDNTAYDQENWGPGWKPDYKNSCYGAPINASIINHNCLSFKITSAKYTGRLANIIESPRYYYGAIQNFVMTKNYGARSCYIQTSTGFANEITISGCMPKGKAWGVSTVIADIMEYNKSLMRNLFKRYNIRVYGNVNAGTAPAHLSTIAVHQSKPLHTLVNEMLKKSDNIIAGSLLKKLGEFHAKQPGSWQNGSEAVKTILATKAFVDPREMKLVDGSGLSPDNKIKPAQIMQVLDFAYHHYGTNAEFISSLPIAGLDGTLKNRLHNVTRKVRAKTGYISGVVALAGYAINSDKEPLAFVIIVNGKNGNTWKYREMEDKIVTALTRYTR